MSRYGGVSTGVFWSIIESCGAQIISFIVNIYMVRALLPEDFGLVVSGTMLLVIGTVFSNSGFGAALIRKVENDEDEHTSVFYFSLISSIIFYFFLWSISPFFESIIGSNELQSIMSILGLVLVFNSVSIISRVKLTKNLDFKIITQCTLIATFFSAILSIVALNLGYGYWSLIIQLVSTSIVSNVLLIIHCPWKPRKNFNFDKFIGLVPFSVNLIFTALVDAMYNNILTFTIAKRFSAHELGLYNQANKLTNTPIVSLTLAIQKATFPALAKVEDGNKVGYYLKLIEICSLLCFPLMFGLSIVAEPIVNLLFGSEWSDISVYMSILSIGMVLYPIQAFAFNLLSVLGHSDYILKLEVTKKVISIILILWASKFGVIVVCFISSLMIYVSVFLNLLVIRKVTSIDMKNQLNPLAKWWVINASIAIFIYNIIGFFEANGMKLFISILVYTLLYAPFLLKFYNKGCNKDG